MPEAFVVDKLDHIMTRAIADIGKEAAVPLVLYAPDGYENLSHLLPFRRGDQLSVIIRPLSEGGRS